MKNIYQIILVVAIALSGSSVFAGSTFKVKYLSAEYVYLRGGTLDGLAVGDRLAISGKDTVEIELEVLFLSEHSASCKVLFQSRAIRPGELAVQTLHNASADTLRVASIPVVPPEVTPPPKPSPTRRTHRKTLSGSVSALTNSWHDRKDSEQDYQQTSLRLNLTARNLLGSGGTFSLYTRGQRDQRNRTSGGPSGRENWQNQIYEMSFSYDDETAPVNIYAGRVMLPRVSSVGYIDGLVLEGRLSEGVRVGMFAGAQPQWQYGNGANSLQKGGGYVNVSHGTYRTTMINLTLAAAGEYHAREVSRELIYLQGRLSIANRWSLTSINEIDLNRSWRKEKTGNGLSFSSVYLNTRYRISEAISTSLNYDTRKNYWTYEMRTVADSLFDYHVRQGLRMQVDVRFPGNLYTYSGVGYRKRTGDPTPVYSYSCGATKTGLPTLQTSLSLQASGYSGPTDNGYNLSARIGQNMRRRDMMSVGYSFMVSNHRSNRSLDLTARFEVFGTFFLGGQYQHSSGDDIKGQRLQAEAGLLF